ncbi:MAG: phosphoglucosamine mutase, partial [Pseudomonadota bacterium]
DLGVMISASHNPFYDNGIKFFGPDGFKLSDRAEAEIEALLAEDVQLVPAAEVGRASRIDGDRARYVEFAKTTFPRHLRLDGLKIVVDCANGAAYRTAPDVLWELGADVVSIGVDPNGFNINDRCGSTDTSTAQEAVVAHGADLGICLDGDADRVMIIDERGQVADGDQIMALIASLWAEDGRLRNNTLVATVMSNLGLERYLADRHLTLERTAVGDRYVVEAMRQGNHALGGEQSGHIVMTDYATTGDGLIAGLQYLAAMVQSFKPASELSHQFEPVPQKLKNVRYAAGADPLSQPSVKDAIAAGERDLMGKGRLLIRKSGTEPLIRVMGEAEDPTLLDSVVEQVAHAVEDAS